VELSVTLPPWQNVVGVVAEIAGAAGMAFAVTVVAADIALRQPSALVTCTV
jgi:hypothetical protein